MQHRIDLLIALQARVAELVRALDELVLRREQEAEALAKQEIPDTILDPDHYRKLETAQRIIADREAQVALQIEYMHKLWKVYAGHNQ